MKRNWTAWKKARKYFGIENQSNLVMHHKDKNLINDDPIRYQEWNPDDLVVLTRQEHIKIHNSNGPWNKGKTNCYSEEQLRKYSESHKGIIPGNARPVQCVETGIIYNSISDAEKANGISCLRTGCDGIHMRGGYHWIFYKE